MNSPFAPFTDEQRARLMDDMKVFYDGFVEKAAAARHTTPGRIDAVAQGRVWTGKQARQHGLVDALGGLDAAVDLAKQRAGIPADEDVELVIYPPRRSLFETLSEQFQSSSFNVWGLLAGGAERQALAALTGIENHEPVHETAVDAGVRLDHERLVRLLALRGQEAVASRLPAAPHRR